MLRELSVQNLALIEDVRVELQPGFCAWTGETGAGKSLLLGALGLLLGERGSADLLRAGADELRVTGRFELDDAGAAPRGRGAPRRAARRGRDHPGAAADAGRPQSRLRQRPAGRRGHAQPDRRPAGGRPRPARKRIAACSRPISCNCSTPSAAWNDRGKPIWNRPRRCASCGSRFAALSAARQQRQRELALVRFEREELDQANLEPGELGRLGPRARTAGQRPESAGVRRAGYAAQLYDEDGSVVERLGKLQREARGVGRARPRTGRGGPPPGGDAVRGAGRRRGRCASWPSAGRPTRNGSKRSSSGCSSCGGWRRSTARASTT